MPSTVATNGIYTSATLYPSKPGDATRKRSTLAVEVDVSDALIRQQAHGADNFERVKVGVPQMKNGKLSWKEVPLKYEGVEIRGYYAREPVDSHEALISGVNASLVKKHGVYVKLEYGDGNTVVWGQQFGKNHKPDSVR